MPQPKKPEYQPEKEEVRFWILSGKTIENWEVAFKDSIWGVKRGLKNLWNKLSKGDVLIFYVTSPISGVVGFGRMETKFKQTKPLYPDEIRINKVVYPFRFEFKTEYSLPIGLWPERKIIIKDLKMNYRAGLNSVKDKDAIKTLLDRAEKSWKTDLADLRMPAKMVREKKAKYRIKRGDLHGQIKDILYEIGKIERFISEKEYPLDSERLDVVWRRVEKGVPTRVFEVHIRGNIHYALAKLKEAFDLWNSDLFLIVKEKEDRIRAEKLLESMFHEIKSKINIIMTDQIEKLYELQVADKKLKEKLGLP